MKTKIILIISIISAIFIYACSPHTDNSTTEIPIINMDEDMKCVDFLMIQTQEFKIRSDEEYEMLNEYRSISPDCINSTLPEIDFSKYILVGKYAAGGGCNIEFERKALMNSSNKIIYNIIVKESGLCDKLGLSMNWALIEKPNKDYKIEFLIG